MFEFEVSYFLEMFMMRCELTENLIYFFLVLQVCDLYFVDRLQKELVSENHMKSIEIILHILKFLQQAQQNFQW